MPHHEPYSDDVRRAVIEADRQGVPRKEIQERFGISDWTLRAWAGTRRKVTLTEQRLRTRQEARDLHWEGASYVYIAKTLGIPVSTAWDYVNRPYDESLIPRLP